MIMMLERGKPIVIGNWGKRWENQVQPVAVQSKLKGMQKEMPVIKDRVRRIPDRIGNYPPDILKGQAHKYNTIN
jgi:hypothetical protein